jgi:hypothetical protein
MSEDGVAYGKMAELERERDTKMQAAYMDIKYALEQIPPDPSKQAEMVVREIAAGNVANVRMVW